MFFNEIESIKRNIQTEVDLRFIQNISQDRIDPLISRVIVNNDFVIVKLRSNKNQFCPIDIYFGINDSKGYYGIYLNEKAIVYNYEKFDSSEAFEKEVFYFLSFPIKADFVTDKSGSITYIDYTILNNNKVPLCFREYGNKSLLNVLGLKRKYHKMVTYLAWI